MRPLDQIEIPIPCQVPWDSMRGDGRVRHCGQCRQNVYNIAAFSRPEAERLIAEKEGRLCLRIFRRPDGTVITDDCRARLRAARRRGWLVFAGALLVVLWAQIAAQLVGLTGLRRLVSGGPTRSATPLAGELAPPPPASPVLPIPTMGAPPTPHEVRGKPSAGGSAGGSD
jgi:hypothetical protein